MPIVIRHPPSDQISSKSSGSLWSENVTYFVYIVSVSHISLKIGGACDLNESHKFWSRFFLQGCWGKVQLGIGSIFIDTVFFGHFRILQTFRNLRSDISENEAA